MILQSKILCGFGGETEYMTGSTKEGYLFHLTAERAIRYEFVTPEQVIYIIFSLVFDFLVIIIFFFIRCIDALSQL